MFNILQLANIDFSEKLRARGKPLKRFGRYQVFLRRHFYIFIVPGYSVPHPS